MPKGNARSRNLPMLERRFRKILIANRGEVAVRIIRTCRELGILTTAVYSDADRFALHVTMADEAIHIGGNRATESYLNIQNILRAANESGADAVHPGYGFLSENPKFASAVREAGLAFIGPSSNAMELMGSKTKARKFVRELGIPVVPGDDFDDQSPEQLQAAAVRIGFPIAIKAAAGGGGTGIRVIHEAKGFMEELNSASQEAMAAFGDGTVFIERFFERARHIEVQLVADEFGNVVHCFDRECSVQRRRQKVIEECPAPRLGDGLRKRLAEAAIKIATAANYASLGTVEFLVDDDTGDFFFLEMNTRLQVEHAVTEMVTGIDLVMWQISIAEGRPLGRSQGDIALNGHAIECRLYAERPDEGFAPDSGHVHHFSYPMAPGMRVDTGIASGQEVPPHYDPMVAKLIAWGEDRDSAMRRMYAMLRGTQVAGIDTNQRFLLRLLDHPSIVSGVMTTRFVEQNIDALTPPVPQEVTIKAAILAAFVKWTGQFDGHVGTKRIRQYRLMIESMVMVVSIDCDDQGTYAIVDERTYRLSGAHAVEGGGQLITIDHSTFRYAIIEANGFSFVMMSGESCLKIKFASRFLAETEKEAEGTYRAAMTGCIIQVLVEQGSQVQAGDRLVIMESMKMEHVTLAEIDGVISKLWATPGAVVEKGQLLVDIEPINLSKQARG